MTDWYRIDDPENPAPRDGTEILACSIPGGTGTLLVRWTSMDNILTDPEIDEFIRDGMTAEELEAEDWFYADFVHGERLSPDCYPTHWMPLPTPPEDTP